MAGCSVFLPPLTSQKRLAPFRAHRGPAAGGGPRQCCLGRGERVGQLLTHLSLFLPADVDALTKAMEDFELKKAAARAVTGVLASHPNSTDVHIINLSLTFHGQELLSDTKLELNSGRRYGLIGLNGTGEGVALEEVRRKGQCLFRPKQGAPLLLFVCLLETSLRLSTKQQLDPVLGTVQKQGKIQPLPWGNHPNNSRGLHFLSRGRKSFELAGIRVESGIQLLRQTAAHLPSSVTQSQLLLPFSLGSRVSLVAVSRLWVDDSSGLMSSVPQPAHDCPIQNESLFVVHSGFPWLNSFSASSWASVQPCGHPEMVLRGLLCLVQHARAKSHTGAHGPARERGLLVAWKLSWFERASWMTWEVCLPPLLFSCTSREIHAAICNWETGSSHSRAH